MDSALFHTESLFRFVCLLTRVGGLVTFAPFLGAERLAPSIRIVLAAAFTFVLLPAVWGELPPIPPGLVDQGLVVGSQLFLGMLLGLVANLTLEALFMAGEIMGFQVGFSMIRAIDPTTHAESPILSMLQSLLGLLVFLSIDGHHWLIQAITWNFGAVSVHSALSADMLKAILNLSSEIFAVGFSMAAPMVIAAFVVDILMGIIARAAPQIQILLVGMPAKSLLAFAFLYLTAYTFIPLVERHVNGMQEKLGMILRILGG